MVFLLVGKTNRYGNKRHMEIAFIALDSAIFASDFRKQTIMEQVEERYISLLTDFGFKRIFGSAELCDKVFDRLFEEAEIAKFSPLEMREYEASKKAYRDIKNSVDTAKREGIAEGMEKRSLEIARKMLAKGMDAASVMEITGLSVEQMQQLKADFR